MAPLASPVYIQQAQAGEKKHIKRGAKTGRGGASLPFMSFGSALPHALRMYLGIVTENVIANYFLNKTEV